MLARPLCGPACGGYHNQTLLCKQCTCIKRLMYEISVSVVLINLYLGTCCHPTLDYGFTSHGNTRSRKISEVKRAWTWLVLG